MKNFLLRNITDETWAAVKAKAAREGRSIRVVLLRLLDRYVKTTKEKA